MSTSPRAVHLDAHRQLSALCGELGEEVLARVVLLFTPTGELVCQWGAVAEGDVTSLGALGAGTMAASGALARVLGHDSFAQVLHEADDGRSLLLAEIPKHGIFAVVYDRRATVGLVRLRVGQLIARLQAVFAAPAGAAAPGSAAAADKQGLLVSEQDIDNLFGD